MNKIAPWQNKRFHQLLGEIGMSKNKEFKADLVKSYSAINSESSKDLLYNEANNMIKHLEKYAETMKPENEKAADKMRKKIISMLREIGFEKMVGDKKKADMESIYSLVKKIGYLAPKEMNDYKNNELPKLVTQMTLYYKKELKRINSA